MIIVNLMGGVGNQMFQYALGRYLSVLSDQDLFLNTNIYDTGQSNRNFDLDIFKLSKQVQGDIEKALDILSVNSPVVQLNERFFHYDLMQINQVKKLFLSKSEKFKPHVILTGYWQSDKYFNEIEYILREDFHFNNPLYGKWSALNEEILATNSIMINIRRGDYLKKLNYHGVVDLYYINAAIKLIKERVDNPKFYVFSDDMDWCQSNIVNNENMVFVGEEYYDSKYQFYLQLMKNCKHFVISNSSFSWWSAWLSSSKNKIVIAPKKWFVVDHLDTIDLIPSDWITI
ncbi:alpha-1,2-fucosyltransferase [Sphingobacterium sp. Ag1]|uniref:alpha-1,2-fucosyltransferase n=1 Tax=Sphingobacterium sp. Ag1 TaxID=1643451 RepID=UPI00069C9155|nr:alpha-1,2-fucosyltransferase [Sphingobacterium sp. Ag1]